MGSACVSWSELDQSPQHDADTRVPLTVAEDELSVLARVLVALDLQMSTFVTRQHDSARVVTMRSYMISSGGTAPRPRRPAPSMLPSPDHCLHGMRAVPEGQRAIPSIG